MHEGHRERSAAYEIATRGCALYGAGLPGVVQGAELVLSRLGNFPGRDLLVGRYDKSPIRDARLQLEMRVYEVENTIRDAGGKLWKLTDFQFETLEAFRRHGRVSVSAPTSAGKSFILSLEVLRKLRDHENAAIGYVVPTRALIRQVIIDLRARLRESHLPPPIVRNLPRIPNPEDAQNGIVYVLTQERLLSLLDADEPGFRLSGLIVDEAQGIRDGSRGILLQTAIEKVLIRFPNVEVTADSIVNACHVRLAGDLTNPYIIALVPSGGRRETNFFYHL